jgi:hypothetical protein
MKGFIASRSWVCALVLILSFLGLDTSAGQATVSSGPVLPPTALPSDIEITLAYAVHGGCVGRCISYRVVVRGTGVVEYKDLGGEPRDPDRQRSIPIDQVVSLLNEFVRLRFFEAPASDTTEPVVVREGELVRFLLRVGADGPEWDLSVRVGAQSKSVHLYMGFPADLGRLRDLLDGIGGPRAWALE